MGEKEIAWAAGFIDGEAWIGFNTVNKYRSCIPALVVTNTSEVALAKLKALFGGSIHKKKQYNQRWKQCWAWALVGDQCREGLKKLLPYLVVKNEQAALLLDYPKRRNATREERVHIQQKQDEIKSQIKKLNHRGRTENVVE